MQCSDITFLFLVAIANLLCISLFVMTSAVQDTEHRNMFNQYSDNSNSFNNKKEADSTEGKGVNGHPLLVDDLTCALEAIGSAISDSYRIIKGTGSDFVDDSKSSERSWSESVAVLQKQNLLRFAIYAALYPEAPVTKELFSAPGTFTLEKKCMNLFSMFEAIVGNARPYFTHHDTQPEITSESAFVLDLIFFLIFHDEIFTKTTNSIASINCEFESTDGSCLFIMKRIILESDEEIQEKNSRIRMLSTFRIKKGKTFVENLLPEDTRPISGSSMLRLADRMSRNFLRAPIDVRDPEYVSGLRIDTYSFRVPNEFVVQAEQKSKRQVKKDICKWLFVDQYTGNIGDPITFKDKLNILNVPFDTCIISTISKLTNKYLVIVLHDSLVTTVAGRDDSLLNEIKKAANAVVLICTVPKDPLELSAELCIKVEDSVVDNATVEDVFKCVHNVMTSLKPRRMCKQEYEKAVAVLMREPETVTRNLPFDTMRLQSKYNRWKHLLMKLEQEMISFSPTRKYIFSSIFNGCRERIEKISRERVKPLKNYPWDRSDSIMIQLDPDKRRAKFILDQLLPDVNNVRLAVHNLTSISGTDVYRILARCAFKAGELVLC